MILTDTIYLTTNKNRRSNTIFKDETYANQQFAYKFNSWGFRANYEYDVFLNNSVDICIGDSMVMNLGDNISNSWPSILARNNDIPVLNFGVYSAGNDMFKLILERATSLFDVRNIFVEFSYLFRYYNSMPIKFNSHCVDDEVNKMRFINSFNYFNSFDSFYFTFIPEKSYTSDEIIFIEPYTNKNNFIEYSLFPYDNVPHKWLYKDYKDFVDTNRKKYTNKRSYNKLKSDSWPTYEEFINGANIHNDMLSDEFGEFLHLMEVNYDNHHHSDYINLEIATKFNKIVV